MVRGKSIVSLDDAAAVRGRRAIVVDDGPTLTHGGMAYGAGYIAAIQAGATEIVDPRASAKGEARQVFESYPHIGKVLPTMGYSPEQLKDLAETINASQADVVVAGTPIDLARALKLEKPVVRARYRYEEDPADGLGTVVDEVLARFQTVRARI